MPHGDRTGPTGMGPMTGRKMGLCSGYANPGFMNGRFARFGGFFGRGGGRGFRLMFNRSGLPGWLRFGNFSQKRAPLTKDDEVEYLKNQSEYLIKALDEVNKRLSEIKKEV